MDQAPDDMDRALDRAAAEDVRGRLLLDAIDRYRRRVLGLASVAQRAAPAVAAVGAPPPPKPYRVPGITQLRTSEPARQIMPPSYFAGLHEVASAECQVCGNVIGATKAPRATDMGYLHPSCHKRWERSSDSEREKIVRRVAGFAPGRGPRRIGGAV